MLEGDPGTLQTGSIIRQAEPQTCPPDEQNICFRNRRKYVTCAGFEPVCTMALFPIQLLTMGA